MDSFTAIAPLIFIFAIMYFLLIRPQQQRMKQHKQMVENVRRGDTVVTAGGVVGKVAKVGQADDPEITVEIADNVQIRVIKATLSEVRAKPSPSKSRAEARHAAGSSLVAHPRRPHPDRRHSVALPNALPAECAQPPAGLVGQSDRSAWASIFRAVPICCSKFSSTRCRRTGSSP